MLRDGRVLRDEVPYARGEPENPESREDLVAKFVGLTADQLSSSTARSLADRPLCREHEPDLPTVGDILRSPRC